MMESGIEIPSRARSRKTLAQLKALAETVKQLEQNTNFLLRQVLNGGNNKLGPKGTDKETRSSAAENEIERPFGTRNNSG